MPRRLSRRAGFAINRIYTTNNYSYLKRLDKGTTDTSSSMKRLDINMTDNSSCIKRLDKKRQTMTTKISKLSLGWALFN